MSLMELEKQLLCPVCLEMFSKPVVILPCQHNLCRKCASDVLQSGGSSGPGGRFRCPSCRHEVVLNRHGVYGLQRNLLVENIIDICTQHKRAANPSVSAAVSAKPRPLRLMCDEHPDEPINIYCCGCDTPTCSLCKVFGIHQDCDVAPLRQVYEEKQVEVSEGIAGLVAVNDQIQALISEMEKVCRTVEEQSRVCVDIVGRSLDGLILILDQKKQQLLSTIAAEEEQRLTHVRALTHAHTQKLQTGAQLVHRAVLTMDHQGHMAKFIQTTQDLLQKMRESSQGAELQRLEIGFENMSHFNIDTEDLSLKLKNLHFCHKSVNFDDEDDEEETDSVPRRK